MEQELEWRSGASCLEYDPELFFPAGSIGSSAQIAEAKSICAQCPVQVECLSYAIASAQRFGIWGGTDEEERRLMRRRYVAAVRAGADPFGELADIA